MNGKRGKTGGGRKKSQDRPLLSQEAIDAARMVLDIASSPRKRKASPPVNDDDDLEAAIEEAFENDDYLTVAKEDKTHQKKKLKEYTEKQTQINAPNNRLTAKEKKELNTRAKDKIAHIKKALKGTDILIKNKQDEIRAEITQEFEEREHAQKKKKSEQEDPWYISSAPTP